MDNERGPSFFFRNDGRGHFQAAERLGLADATSNGRGVALLDANWTDGSMVVGNWMSEHRSAVALAGSRTSATTRRRLHAEPSAVRTVAAISTTTARRSSS